MANPEQRKEMRGHTPGPWLVDENGNVNALTDVVAEVYESADAQLIAAAPDLYDAVKRAYSYLSSELEEHGSIVAEVVAEDFFVLLNARRKAEGQEPFTWAEFQTRRAESATSEASEDRRA